MEVKIKLEQEEILGLLVDLCDEQDVVCSSCSSATQSVLHKLVHAVDRKIAHRDKEGESLLPFLEKYRFMQEVRTPIIEEQTGLF